MSWTLENAISDAGIARLAERLADRSSERLSERRAPEQLSQPLSERPAERPPDRLASDAAAERAAAAARYRAFARYFRNRSLSCRVLFDAEAGFFRGRDGDGSFGADAFDPRVWGGDYVETNAWGMSVSPVHDGPGLAALYGGPTGLGAHLDLLFAEPETGEDAFGGTYGTVIHEQREARALRSGMCAISNQPAHHIPWMYVHSDRPWQAGATVHALAERLFAGAMIGQGFPGDEDNGEMSMWWLWAALGLYPLELASGELRIGSPLYDDITVRRAGGSALRIRSVRADPDARLLVGARLNGVELERAVLPVDALAEGAELELEFSSDPRAASRSRIWAAAPPRPASWRPDLTGALPGDVAPVAWVRPDLTGADQGASSGWLSPELTGADPGGASGWPMPIRQDKTPLSPARRASARQMGAARPDESDGLLGDLFDDGASGRAVRLEQGEWAGWQLAAPRTVTDVTLTAAEVAAVGSWIWEASDDGSEWHPMLTTHAEPLIANRTTPFTFAAPVVARMLRVRALGPLALGQLELFDLTSVDVTGFDVAGLDHAGLDHAGADGGRSR